MLITKIIFFFYLVAESSTTKKKRGRGVAKGLALEPPSGTEWVVEWDHKGCPVGDMGRKLNRQIAFLAKNFEMWPLDKHATDIDQITYRDTWKIIEVNILCINFLFYNSIINIYTYNFLGKI